MTQPTKQMYNTIGTYTDIRTLLVQDEQGNVWIKLCITTVPGEFSLLINPDQLTTMAQGFHDTLIDAHQQVLKLQKKSDIIIAPADTLHTLKDHT